MASMANHSLWDQLFNVKSQLRALSLFLGVGDLQFPPPLPPRDRRETIETPVKRDYIYIGDIFLALRRSPRRAGVWGQSPHTKKIIDVDGLAYSRKWQK